jgi:glycosyltransferase involved in cell wall biosynthesis
MKVLTVVLNLEKGGTQRAAQNFCESYQLLGHDSRVLAMAEGGPRAAELRGANIVVWETLEAARPHIQAWRPDVVHLHSHGLRAGEIQELRGVTDGARFIETNVFCRPTDSEPQLLSSFQLSTWCLFLYRCRGGDPAKGAIVPNPVKCDTMYRASNAEVAAFKEQLGIPADRFVVGRVGQALARKWSPSLLDIFRKFSVEVAPNSHLLLCNPPPELVAMLRADPALMSRTTIVPSLIGDQQLRYFYSALDVMLHISDTGESFGMVIPECLLCETPVITLNTPWGDNAQGEIVGNEVGGVAVNTLDEVFASLGRLHADPDTRVRMGRMGREHVLSSYEMRAVAARALEVLEQRPSTRLQLSSLFKYMDDDLIGRALIALMYITRSDRAMIWAQKYFLHRSGLSPEIRAAIPGML